MKRYTPVPPIRPTLVAQMSESTQASSDEDDDDDDDVDKRNSEDEDTELDEDFQLSNEQRYEDIKQAMKKRMRALSGLDAFDNQVCNFSV